MTLFVTRHQHSLETCPAGDTKMGPMLLQHVSDDNAAKMGIKIQGEVVVDNHTFYMILDAPDMQVVEQYMTPFTQVGTVEIFQGDACATVVARGSCVT